MKFQKLILTFIVILLCPVFVQKAFSRELKAYQGEITVPIQEKDIVHARNRAFQTLQNLLLSAAIQDLVGPSLFEEYRFDISRNKSLSPSEFLVSAKVLAERNETSNFYMKLEGKIEISSLSDALRNLNLILKDDPWHPVTILVESNLAIPQDRLKDRLSLFHIRLREFNFANLENFDWQVREKKEFIEALLHLFPDSKIIYLVDTIPGEDKSQVTALRAQIYRMSDLKQINSFQLNLASPVAKEKLTENNIDNFIKLFTIQSVVAGLYDEGSESNLTISVEGLSDSYIRYMFENNVLTANRAIKSYILTTISHEIATYEIQSSYSIKELEDFFRKKNPDFYFITEKGDTSNLIIETFYRFNDEVSELTEWERDESVLNLIRDSQAENEIDPNQSTADSLFNQAPDNENYIPEWIETEPNNSSRNLNNMPPASLVLGYISSRADEDVYQLKRSVNSSKLVVEWIRVGKTTLSPQLRLYDQEFAFINNYNLTGSQNRLRFQYTFKENPPHKVFLRITDKVGFIQGETGGFKSFYYLLRCYWDTGEAQVGAPLSGF
ncbi:hypothetical protein KJ966_12155 [bacterium]|nr:hypothetical protein [bacterium]